VCPSTPSRAASIVVDWNGKVVRANREVAAGATAVADRWQWRRAQCAASIGCPWRRTRSCWTEAQDRGDPKVESAASRSRDGARELPGRRTAVVQDRTPCRGHRLRRGWQSSRWRPRWTARRAGSGCTATDASDPSRPGTSAYERSTQDAYGDPGQPISERHAGRPQPAAHARRPRVPGGRRRFGEGQPAVRRCVEPRRQPKDRLFRAAEGRHETFVGFLDDAGSKLLVRSESPTDPPSLVVVERGSDTRKRCSTSPTRPPSSFAASRSACCVTNGEDGVPLSGTLYLPQGHKTGVKYPTLSGPTRSNTTMRATRARCARDTEPLPAALGRVASVPAARTATRSSTMRPCRSSAPSRRRTTRSYSRCR
jgi:hypothetical protein